MKQISFWALATLSLAVSAASAASDNSAATIVVADQALSSTETVSTIRLPPGITVTGSTTVAPPELPTTPIEEDERELHPLPFAHGSDVVPPDATSETLGNAAAGVAHPVGAIDSAAPTPQAAGTFTLIRDNVLAPTMISSVNEPSVGGSGDWIFTTHNWYAEFSTNNGTAFTYLDPYTLFPNSPAAFSGGFCCDQRVAQDSSRNLVFWYLQYVDNGSVNGVRLAVAHGQAGLAANTWQYHDFSPSTLGLPANRLLDFPQMQLSANYLYFTTNVFTVDSGDCGVGQGSFCGALIVRLKLSELDANSSLNVVKYFNAGGYGAITPVSGAEPSGTRAGSTTMYFGAVGNSTSIGIWKWPESVNAPTLTTKAVATTSFNAFTCTAPDGTNPCGRGDFRSLTGWLTSVNFPGISPASGGELGFMWGSSGNGGTRPYPYTRVAIFDPATLALKAQPDIWSSTSAWLYPIVAVDERGHLGGVIDNLGGSIYSSLRALIRDDFSPAVTSGWETYSIATSTAGTSSRWGDYNGASAHAKYPDSWLGVGHVQTGGAADANAKTHNIWFARGRDASPSITVTRSGSGGGTVSSNPSGIVCGAVCTASYTLGSTVTLTAAPNAQSNFTGWTGACSGTSTCVLSMTGARTATATFTLKPQTLTVTKSGTGTGTVTSQPTGVACGETCSAPFDNGTTVTLTATPSAGSVFAGWSGACVGGGNCVLVMDGGKALTATFNQTYTLSAMATDANAFTQAGRVESFAATISNAGPGSASNVQVSSVLSAELDPAGATWSCTAAPSGCTTARNGSGALAIASLALAPSCALACTQSATVKAGPTDTATFSLQAVPPVGFQASTASAQTSVQVVLFRNAFESGGDGVSH